MGGRGPGGRVEREARLEARRWRCCSRQFGISCPWLPGPPLQTVSHRNTRGRRIMTRAENLRAAGLLVMLASLEFLVCGPAYAAESSGPLAAIWRVQELKLTHRDDRTLYSCAELASRVSAILAAVGVRVANGMDARCTG